MALHLSRQGTFRRYDFRRNIMLRYVCTCGCQKVPKRPHQALHEEKTSFISITSFNAAFGFWSALFIRQLLISQTQQERNERYTKTDAANAHQTLGTVAGIDNASTNVRSNWIRRN